MRRLEEIARALGDAGLDGWLFYDFRHSDPLAYRILGLSSQGITTRRWFCYVPARGPARALVSAVEAERLAELGIETMVYRSADGMLAALGDLMAGARRIAMNYSPRCAIPYVARVDAGTVEIVRSLGVEIVSAADLIQRFEARLESSQLESHRRAAALVRHLLAFSRKQTLRPQVLDLGDALSDIENLLKRLGLDGNAGRAPHQPSSF